MSSVRVERDSFGPIEVPSDRLWGAQTQRSLQNFRISGERMPLLLVHSLVRVKRAAAEVNRELGVLDAGKADAIMRAADEVLAGLHDDEFPLVVWQSGSGTQTKVIFLPRIKQTVGRSERYREMLVLSFPNQGCAQLRHLARVIGNHEDAGAVVAENDRGVGLFSCQHVTGKTCLHRSSGRPERQGADVAAGR